MPPREYHEDGSYTERYEHSLQSSITFNPDGSVREETRHESSIPFAGFFGHKDMAVTYDGEGKFVNGSWLKK